MFPYGEIDASGALMTALPYGKAIIASRLGLFAELLSDPDTAYLVPPENPEALAAAITRAFHNRAKGEEMGTRAAMLAKSVLSWERIARLTMDAYGKAREIHRD